MNNFNATEPGAPGAPAGRPQADGKPSWARLRRKALLLLLLGAGCGNLAAAASTGGGMEANEATRGPRAPKLSPDYAGIVFPPNIAPLNFKVEEPGSGYRAEFRSTQGHPLTVTSRDGAMRIPLRPWRELVGANAGEWLLCDVSVRDPEGRWTRFATVTNLVARETIDSCLVY